MLIYGFLLVLLLRPSWGLLGFFTAVATVLWLVFNLPSQPIEMLPVTLIAVALQALVFYGTGHSLFSYARGKENRPQTTRSWMTK